MNIADTYNNRLLSPFQCAPFELTDLFQEFFLNTSDWYFQTRYLNRNEQLQSCSILLQSRNNIETLVLISDICIIVAAELVYFTRKIK